MLLSVILSSQILITDFTSVKYQAKPQVIFTSTKSEEGFLAALQKNGM